MEERITNMDNEKGGYRPAPKESPQSGAPEKSQGRRQIVGEVQPLKEKNREQWARF